MSYGTPFFHVHQLMECDSQALRLVYSMTIDRSTALDCMSDSASELTDLWPSSLYSLLATAAIKDPILWRRCEERVEATLRNRGVRFGECAPVTLAQLFLEGRDKYSGIELVGLLWALVRLRCPTVSVMTRRLGAELETIAAARLVFGASTANSNSHSQQTTQSQCLN